MPRYLLIPVLLLALVFAAPAAAGDVTIGGACLVSNRGQGPQGDGNNAVCISNIWQYPAYQFGSTSANCNGTNAGMVQYTGGVFQGCNGSIWSTLSSAALSSLLAATITNSRDLCDQCKHRGRIWRLRRDHRGGQHGGGGLFH